MNSMMQQLEYELIHYVFNPERMNRLCEDYHISRDELSQIY
jgi:hypothetical protein